MSRGCCGSDHLAIVGGTAAAMAIVTSTFNSDHPNYVYSQIGHNATLVVSRIVSVHLWSGLIYSHLFFHAFNTNLLSWLFKV
jgi:hypothetical protein